MSQESFQDEIEESHVKKWISALPWNSVVTDIMGWRKIKTLYYYNEYRVYHILLRHFIYNITAVL